MKTQTIGKTEMQKAERQKLNVMEIQRGTTMSKYLLQSMQKLVLTQTTIHHRLKEENRHEKNDMEMRTSTIGQRHNRHVLTNMV